MSTTLVVRLDSAGDVLLSGPAVRAAAHGSDRVVLLCGPRGAAAADLLPGIDEVVVWRCPWVDAAPDPVDRTDVAAVVTRLADARVDRALVLTSFHQSPLPTALVLRLAGVPWVGAVSEDYPGSLLDLRHALPEHGLHEVERMLSLTTASGLPLPPDDDRRLAVRRDLPDTSGITGTDRYVVVHPGAAAPARAASPRWSRELVRRLAADGRRVIVTGGPDERELAAYVVGGHGTDVSGSLPLAGLADVLRRADAVVSGNTGPAHLAAAVGTPVVSLFAPVVPAERWRPWGVPHVLLGDQAAPCALTRARTCPVPGHPCLDAVDQDEALSAVSALTTDLLEAV